MRIWFGYFKTFLIWSFIIIVGSQDEITSQTAIAELEIANLELQDDCENFANTMRSSLKSNTFHEKMKVREAHGDLLKVIAENLQQFETYIPSEFLRNWTFFVKPGDALLKEQEWSTLINFDVSYDELIHSMEVHCNNATKNCVSIKSGFDNIMRTSKNSTLLKKNWEAWQTVLAWKKNQFPNVLNLVNKAAGINEYEDAKTYWEVLTDKQDSYVQAEEFWEQIKPLYFNLHKFVKERLFRFYNITKTDSEIPVYLLGSNFGDDWSEIADIILPHPFLHYLTESYLNKTKITDIYKSAEKLTKTLNMGSLGSKFWTNSIFNMSFCENYVLSHCVQEYSELLTCGDASWTSYLNAFEVALDVSLRNTDYLTLAQSNLRYSVIDEAVKGLGSIFAIKNLRHENIWKPELFTNNESIIQPNEMTELLLTALRVLPKLPYFLAADKWRLHLLENGFDNFTEKWWNYRKEYQGVEGIFNNETDFLGDSYITSNKPYLSQFLGTILQFQLLNYYKPDWTSPNQSYVDSISHDDNFLRMLHEKSSIEWPNLVVNYFGIYDLSVEPLLDYFAPLNNYLETAPIEQIRITTTSKPKTVATKKSFKDEKNTKLSKPVELKTVYNKLEDDEPPLPPKHEHVEENLEGPNPSMEIISTYTGIGLLVIVGCIIAYVIISKKMKKKRSNNRRFET